MSPATFENATCADGSLLVAWLEQRRELPKRVVSTLGESTARRLHHWRSGHRAEFWAVDRVLTQLGLHVSMVPDEVWILGDARHLPSPKVRSTRRKSKIKPRYCKTCGDEIPRKRRGEETYALVVFCSQDCTKAAKGGWLGQKVYFAPKEDAA